MHVPAHALARVNAALSFCFSSDIFCEQPCPYTAAMQTMQQSIAKVTPILTKMVAMHEADTYPEGVEAFNTEIMNTIDEAGLMQFETRQLESIGTSWCNRETGMLVPIDAHDLLAIFAENGYSPSLWQVLSARVPAGPEGEKWKQANIDLVDASDELLAPLVKDQIEVITGRGSHSCAALRIAKFAARAIHPELSGADGRVSKAKFLSMQPSWKQLLEKGVGMKTIPGELELAVPGLLACLSRVGNASHDVYRTPTSIQLCSRIHALYGTLAKGAAADWDKVAKQASTGNGGVKMLPKIKQLCDFVKAWSGGKDHAALIKEIQGFERTLTVKRKIYANDLQSLSTVDLLHAPKYVSATRLI